MAKVTITQESATLFLTEFEDGKKTYSIDKVYDQGNNISFERPNQVPVVVKFDEIDVYQLGAEEATVVEGVGGLIGLFKTLRYANFKTGEAAPDLSIYGPKEVGAFTGEFALDRKGPDYYDVKTQAASLTLSIGANAIVGGIAHVVIVANGSAITIPSGWDNIGSDSVSTTSGVKNHFIVQKTKLGIEYCVKNI